jgi:hypothetical protein
MNKLPPSAVAAADAQDNFGRLLNHLGDNSLARKLVGAYQINDANMRAVALKTVIQDTLTELREKLEQPEN